jgi:hypothetical protein
MSLNSLFNIVYDLAIILAVVTFALCFLYLFSSRGKAEE